MSKMYRNAILACTVAIAVSFAGAGAAWSQDAAKQAAPKQEAPKQVASAKTDKKSASVSPSSSSEKHVSHGKVYLLRGLLNIFSLGMDDLAAKLERRGVTAGVYEYGQWEALCNDAAARVRAGGGPIVLVGHSLGADAVVDMANKLGQMGVPVALVVAFDPTVSNVLTGRTTSTFINYYQSDNGFGRPVARGAGFHGTLSNVDLRRHTEFGHGSIDKSAMLHNAVIGRVLALVGRGSKPKPTDASAAPAQTPVSSSAPRAETGSVPRTQQ